MKYLISTLLSIIIFSNFLLGQETQILFEWKTSNGLEWKSFGDEDIHSKYEGNVENNKPHGIGILKYPDGSKYIGEFINGKPYGQGNLIQPNGEKYVGEWKDGKKEGQGKFTDSLGNIYEGRWQNNKLNGQAKEIFPDGHIYYEGEWKDGERDGYGILTDPNGYTYHGEWRNGLEHGQGTETKSNEKYEGEWKDGKRDGYGILIDKNSEYTYEGEWKNGEMHGKSTVKDKGQLFQLNGNFSHSSLHGKVKITISNGYSYEGKFEKNKLVNFKGYDNNNKIILNIKNGNGYGVIFWGNGEKYEGEFKDGSQKGYGIYTCCDGWNYIGDWHDRDQLWNGIGYNNKGEIIFKINKGNGKGIKLGSHNKSVGEWRDKKEWNTKVYDKNGKLKGEYKKGIYTLY